MKMLPGLRFGFGSRDEIIGELTNGRDAMFLVGIECATCHLLHRVNFIERLTTFSDRDRIDAPSSIEITVEDGKRNTVPTKICPADGVADDAHSHTKECVAFRDRVNRERLRSKANANIFAHGSNAGSCLEP